MRLARSVAAVGSWPSKQFSFTMAWRRAASSAGVLETWSSGGLQGIVRGCGGSRRDCPGFAEVADSESPPNEKRAMPGTGWYRTWWWCRRCPSWSRAGSSTCRSEGSAYGNQNSGGFQGNLGKGEAQKTRAYPGDPCIRRSRLAASSDYADADPQRAPLAELVQAGLGVLVGDVHGDLATAPGCDRIPEVHSTPPSRARHQKKKLRCGMQSRLEPPHPSKTLNLPSVDLCSRVEHSAL